MDLELSNFELDQARRSVEEANLLLDKGMHNGAASRAYYAVYHAIKSILYVFGVRAKSHKGVAAQFGRHVIQRGHMGREHDRIRRELYKLRDIADYGSLRVISGEEAAKAVKGAGWFVGETTETLKRLRNL